MTEPSTHSAPHGILLVDKPVGKTSFGLVAQLRKLLNVRKIGHAGTLDPFATGVMVMLIGRDYTKLSDRFLTQDKEYTATLKLGQATDTYDCDGTVTFDSHKEPTLEELKEAISAFQGEIQQTPPMYSAKKINGKKLYDLARKGLEVERKPVSVMVEIELITYDYPLVSIRVACSKGTYIRSLAHDIGSTLKCGAHLVQLRRTKSGPFRIEECVCLESKNSAQVMSLLQTNLSLGFK